MLNRVTAVLALIAALSAAALGYWALSLHDENKRLGDAVSSLQVDLAASQKLRLSDQAVATRYAKSVALLTTANKVANANLQQALSANAAWADSPVPPDVAAALGMPSPTPAR